MNSNLDDGCFVCVETPTWTFVFLPHGTTRSRWERFDYRIFSICIWYKLCRVVSQSGAQRTNLTNNKGHMPGGKNYRGRAGNVQAAGKRPPEHGQNVRLYYWMRLVTGSEKTKRLSRGRGEVSPTKNCKFKKPSSSCWEHCSKWTMVMEEVEEEAPTIWESRLNCAGGWRFMWVI